MTVVTDLVLCDVDLNGAELAGDNYHLRLAQVVSQGEHKWLARSPLAYLILDRESAEYFLRSRDTAFPGREIAELFGVNAGRLREQIDANILNQQGERHRRLRALVGPAFTPRAADRWRPAMRDFLGQLWEPVAEAASCDLVAALAKPYPSLTIAAVLGAPDQDAPRLHEWSSLVQRQFDIKALASQVPQIERAVVELQEYVEQLLEQRRAEPGDDLITALLAAEDRGDRLSHEECVNLVVNVIAGGVDTTQAQLSHAMRLFAAHPDQWELLRARPQLTQRANSEQPDGEKFDIAAERDGRLLTFGAGTHYCLGSNLARAELEEALAFLAPRMPGLAAAGPAVLGGVEGIYGIDELPLRWAAAGSS